MRAIGVALAVGYPVLVYLGLRWLEPRALALLLGAILLARALPRLSRRPFSEIQRILTPFALVALVLAAAALWNQERFFLFVPPLVSGALLVSFARTLWSGPSMIESIARMQVTELSPAEVRYCARVTVVWCCFFAVNAGIALALALEGSLGAWALYTGVVAYLLIGILFACEFVYRAWRFRRYLGGPTDALLRRLFPPEPME